MELIKTKCYEGTLYELIKEKEPELDDWIKPFINELNERLKK